MHISQQRFALLHPSGRLCVTDTAIARPHSLDPHTRLAARIMTYSAAADDDHADRHPLCSQPFMKFLGRGAGLFFGRCGGHAEIFFLRVLPTCAISKLAIE